MVNRLYILIGMLLVPTVQAMDNGTAPDMDALQQELACVGSGPAFFKSPLDREVLIQRPNRVLPVRLQLFDVYGTEVGRQQLDSPPVLQVVFIEAVSGNGAPNELRNTGRGDEGNTLKYRGGHWQFNLSTSNYSAPGRYSITVEAGSDSYSIDPACIATFVIQ